ncbi:MAG: ATP-binding protein [Planctomycetia bacterium]|nr:ATP-binding protein [Planctomycetia bacterium]
MTAVLVLTIYEKNGLKKHVPLEKGEYIIGRDSTCTVYLADTEVSRRHAQLLVETCNRDDGDTGNTGGIQLNLMDLGSLNGTFINGHQVKNYLLQVGDRIQIGGTLLVVEVLESAKIDEKEEFREKNVSNHARRRNFKNYNPNYSALVQENEKSASVLEVMPDSLMGTDQFSQSGIGIDSVDITNVSSNDQILRRISHTEGRNLLSDSQNNPQKSEWQWAFRAQDFLQLLYEMTLSSSRCTDIGRLSTEILDMIFQLLEPDRGCILLFDMSTNRLIPRAKKIREKFQKQKMIISKTILDYVLEHREGVLTSNAQNDTRWEEANSVVTVGIHEAICVPLQGRYGILGAIYLDTFSHADRITRTETPRFNDECLKLMITIAHHIALAVEDTRYYRGMLQAERLAAIGQTVTTLSHHIKNILQGIQGGSFLIRSGLEAHNEEFVSKGWKIVERNQSRISALIMDMLTFSKERKPELVLTNVNRVVSEVVELMTERAIKANISLVWTPDGEVPNSLVDPEAINHAVLNLVTNAIDAVVEMQEERKRKYEDPMQTIRMDSEESFGENVDSDVENSDEHSVENQSESVVENSASRNDLESIFADGSHIFSELEDVDEIADHDGDTGGSGINLPSGQIDVLTLYDSEKNLIRIFVKDTGPGLTKEQVATIFRPFESSKGNRGTGLGLPVCKKIVREHGGTIHVEQRSPHGCRFIITLPVVQDLN